MGLQMPLFGGRGRDPTDETAHLGPDGKRKRRSRKRPKPYNALDSQRYPKPHRWILDTKRKAEKEFRLRYGTILVWSSGDRRLRTQGITPERDWVFMDQVLQAVTNLPGRIEDIKAGWGAIHLYLCGCVTFVDLKGNERVYARCRNDHFCQRINSKPLVPRDYILLTCTGKDTKTYGLSQLVTEHLDMSPPERLVHFKLYGSRYKNEGGGKPRCNCTFTLVKVRFRDGSVKPCGVAMEFDDMCLRCKREHMRDKWL